MGSGSSTNGFRLELLDLSCVRKLLWFRVVGSTTGYMRGKAIGDGTCLVDSIDREGCVAKVSGKSDDFWLRSLGRNVEGLSVGEVVRRNWLEIFRRSVTTCESIG